MLRLMCVGRSRQPYFIPTILHAISNNPPRHSYVSVHLLLTGLDHIHYSQLLCKTTILLSVVILHLEII